MIKKNIQINGSVEFIKFYNSLQKTDSIKENIESAMNLLKQNISAGDRLPNNLWPKKLRY